MSPGWTVPAYRCIRRFVVLGTSSLLLIGPAFAEERIVEYTLTLRDYRFEPDTLTAVVGVPVVLTLVNPERITPHNFTLEQGGGEPISADVAARETQTVRFTPTATGTYNLHCDTKLLWFKSHRAHGMEGTLVVVQAMMGDAAIQARNRVGKQNGLIHSSAANK